MRLAPALPRALHYNERPPFQGGHNGRELGHGTFCGFLVRCVLDCGCPLSSAEGGAFFWASRAGQGAPAPANFAQLLGERGPLLWACQKGQIGQKMVRFGQLVAARSRQDGLIERRPEEQGTQDAHKKQMRGCGYSLHGN
jgi:hypothetical protein